ncbi:hypothetical protein OH779_01880 [Actinacidiphila glaucinigra]|uniref:hypothetical protein n=1 Tax=Actinacidiphila glaucinigra TaxID=235986 RepID=UPI00386309BA
MATDVGRLADMLRDDVRCSMPPTPGLSVDRDTVVTGWIEDGFEGMKGLRGVATSVNRQPAVAFHLWNERDGANQPLTLDVLRVTGGLISEIVIFHRVRGGQSPQRLAGQVQRPDLSNTAVPRKAGCTFPRSACSRGYGLPRRPGDALWQADRADTDKIEAVLVTHEMLDLPQGGVTDESDPPSRSRESQKPSDDVHRDPEVVLVDARPDGQRPWLAAVRGRSADGTDQQGHIGAVERVARRPTTESPPGVTP